MGYRRVRWVGTVSAGVVAIDGSYPTLAGRGERRPARREAALRCLVVAPIVGLVVLSGLAGFAPGAPISGGAGRPAVAPGPVGRPPTAPIVVRRSAFTQIGSGSLLERERGTATCEPGEAVLSGGYAAEHGAVVLHSFPSTSDGQVPVDGAEVNSWTVTLAPWSQPHKQPGATVFALCLRDSTARANVITTSREFDLTPGEAHASCPDGAVLSGGGYRSGQGYSGAPDFLAVGESASFPDPHAPGTWTMFGQIRHPPGDARGNSALGTVFAVCITGPAVTTGTEFGPHLVFQEGLVSCLLKALPQGSPSPTPSQPDAVPPCSSHQSAELSVACPTGVLFAAAAVPFRIIGSAAFDTANQDPAVQISASQPDDGSGSDAVSRWTVQADATYPVNSFNDSSVRGREFPTVVLCASVVLAATPAPGPVIAPAPPRPPVAKTAEADKQFWPRPLGLTLGAVSLGLLAGAALLSRRLRRRSRSNPPPHAIPARVWIKPTEPVDTIRLAGQHTAVALLLDPTAATHSWTERNHT